MTRHRAFPAPALPVLCCLVAAGATMDMANLPQEGPSVPDQAPIILLGASFAEGWRLPAVAGSPVVNRGVGGQQTFELLDRFDRDVIAARPRAVIIWGHINDIFRTSRDSVDAAVVRARESYAEMVRKARSAGIEVILASEITMRRRAGMGQAVRAWIGGLLGKEGYDTWINGHVLALNDWLRTFAAREGILLLDLQPVLVDSRGRRRPETCQPDGVHVSSAGYDALTAHAFTLLERHFSALPDRGD